MLLVRVILVFVVFTFLYNGFGVLFWRFVLLLRPRSCLAFRAFAINLAPFFGLGCELLPKYCNLDSECSSCRLWTCSRCGDLRT